jgi:hypothetical protein
MDDRTEECYNQLFDNLPVDPLTVKENTTEWFLLRAFSCTSSATDQLLNSLKKLYTNPQTHNLISDAIAMNLKVVLDIVPGPRWDETIPTVESPQSEPTPAAEDRIFSHLNPKKEAELMTSFQNAKILTSGMMTAIEFELKEQIVNNTL